MNWLRKFLSILTDFLNVGRKWHLWRSKPQMRDPREGRKKDA
jgi:hypothetical protein